MPFSVLLSLYAKEKADFLRQSLESVFNQTLLPDEVVLVLDGPITTDLQEVVDDYSSRYNSLKVIPLAVNQGLGKALNEGLKHCSYDLVARMDTDDICYPNRFDEQVNYMNEHREIAACSAWIDEFIDTPQNITTTRKLPETHEELIIYGKSRNPLNHPSVIFRKSAVENAGGYLHFPLFEDYYLWARMIMNGSRIHNLQESLLFFRSSPEMFKRRGGWKYAKDEMRFQAELKRIGYISNFTLIKNNLIRFGIRIMPNSLRGYIYKKLLRK